MNHQFVDATVFAIMDYHHDGIISQTFADYFKQYGKITDDVLDYSKRFKIILPSELHGVYVKVHAEEYKGSIGVVVGLAGEINHYMGPLAKSNDYVFDGKGGLSPGKYTSLFIDAFTLLVQFDGSNKHHAVHPHRLIQVLKQPKKFVQPGSTRSDMFGSPLKVGDVVIARTQKSMVFGTIEKINQKTVRLDAFHATGPNAHIASRKHHTIPFDELVLIDNDTLSRILPNTDYVSDWRIK